MMCKIINCRESKTEGPGEGNRQLIRLPQSNCREFGLGCKSEDALKELARLPHRRAGSARVALLGPDCAGSLRPWYSEPAQARRHSGCPRRRKLGCSASPGGAVPPSKQPRSLTSLGALPQSQESRRQRREDARRPSARRGRAFGWKWDSVSSGKAGLGELFGRLSSFGGARPRAPEAAQPRERTNGGWQTWDESALGIRMPEF